jgi:hypothetical protein
MLRRIGRVAIAAGMCLILTGCAGAMTSWLVNLRNSQGDSALANGKLVEAQKEYQLALALAQVLFQKASANFLAAKLDFAETEVRDALKYAPDDANAQALASEIEQAKIRRDIVIANYPAYASVGASIGASLKSVAATNKDIAKQVTAFGYDYDPTHLSKAIAEAYALQDELVRITQRLASYRTLVQAGVPKTQGQITTDTPNLLPIP